MKKIWAKVATDSWIRVTVAVNYLQSPVFVQETVFPPTLLKIPVSLAFVKMQGLDLYGIGTN